MTNKELRELLSVWPDNYKIIIYLDSCGSDQLDLEVHTTAKEIIILEQQVKTEDKKS